MNLLSTSLNPSPAETVPRQAGRQCEEVAQAGIVSMFATLRDGLLRLESSRQSVSGRIHGNLNMQILRPYPDLLSQNLEVEPGTLHSNSLPR